MQTGTINLANYGVALSGSSVDINAALAGTFGSTYSGAVTITNDDYTLAHLKAINVATSNSITLDHDNVTLSGNSTDIAAALDGTITQHDGSVVITNDDYTLPELKSINNKTNGIITLDHVNVDLSGSSSDIAAALAGSITTHEGDITITNNDYTALELKAINDKTLGDITLQTTAVDLEGTSSVLQDAFDGTVSNHTGAVTITNSNYTVLELVDINGATSGDITLDDPNVALSGSSTNIVAALDPVVTQHTATVTITNNDYTVAHLKAINTATNGDIVLSAPNSSLSGSAADLVLAFAGTVTTHAGTTQITGTYNVDQLKTISDNVSGAITLANAGVVLWIFIGFTICLLEDHYNSYRYCHYHNNYTTAELKAINAATNGAITLDVDSVNLSGTSSDLVLAFAGDVTQHEGNVEITNDSYNLTELVTINAATNGEISLLDTDVDLSGTSGNLVSAFAGTVTEHDGNVTITNNDYTVDQLKTINAATTGDINLSAPNASLSGSAANLVLAFAGTVTTHAGSTEITGSYDVTQLKTISDNVSGAITLDDASVDISGSSSDLNSAFSKITTTHTGAVTITNILTQRRS